MNRHLKLGLVTAAIVYGTTLLVFLQVPGRLFGEHGSTVRIRFAQTADLTKGDPVRVDGVVAGRVKDVDVTDGGRAAMVTVGVFEDAMPVYRNARAAIRWRTVLGGNEYVDLDRGTPSAGTLSGPIPIARTETQVELDDVTTTLRGSAGTGLKSTFRELGTALAEPAPVREVVRTLAGSAPRIAEGVGALRGRQPGDLRAVVASAAQTVKALDGDDEPVRRLLQGAATTLGVTARRAASLDSLLRQTPGTLGVTRTTLANVDHTLDLADPLVARLRASADDVAPTLRRVRPVLTGADRLLTDARPLLRALQPAVHRLAAATGKAVPLVRDLRPSVVRVDEQILPHLAERDPVTRRAAYEMIGPTLSAAMDATGLYDSTGRYLRFPALSNLNPLDGVPCRVVVGDPEAKGAIAHCEGALEVLNDLLKNPLPPQRP
jgi:phospholipid/cholesterol/gamma-HCH transport system substrate-binding protein